MTKMAATPMYNKTYLNPLLQNQLSDDFETWYVAMKNMEKCYNIRFYGKVWSFELISWYLLLPKWVHKNLKKQTFKVFIYL